MKKIISLAIMAIFIFSLIPLAFAEEGQTGTNTEINAGGATNAGSSTGDASAGSGAGAGLGTEAGSGVKAARERAMQLREEAKAKAEARKQANIERLKILREENRAKIKALDAEKLDRISNLSGERLQKIAELDKRQIERLAGLNIKNLDKIAGLKKDRLERISNLSEERLERLAGLEKEKLEKVSDLSEAELEKLAVLGRARLKNFVEKDGERLKLELKALKVVKVKNADDLNRRYISETRLSQLKERFDNANERFDEAKDRLKEAGDKLKEAKERGDENAILEHAKAYLLRTADALINHLEKIKSKVQEINNIDDDREAKIVAEIDAQIAEINLIKADAQAATTKEQIKEAAKKLRTKWNRLKHLIRLHAERVVAARVEGIVNRGIVLEKKIEHMLAKAKEKGIEVNVDTEVNTFSEKIAEAKDKYQQAQTKLSAMLELKAGNATNEQIKATADEANALLKEARDAIKEAHDILKTIVKKIKEAMPEADLSEEVEVEVSQETTAGSDTTTAGSGTETSATTGANAATTSSVST